jgi:hypothetical protein
MTTPLQTFAIMCHEMYVAFREAGFSDAQAIFLTSQRMNADAKR